MTPEYKDMYDSLPPQDCGCRTTCCPHCNLSDFKRNGSFKRRDDGRRVQRYFCYNCQRSFSRAGFSPYYRQWHRRKNELMRKLMAQGNSYRSIAMLLGIDKDTVARRLRPFALLARNRHLKRR